MTFKLTFFNLPLMGVKRIEIFSAKAGAGHESIAKAIKGEIGRLDPLVEVELTDGLKNIGYSPEKAFAFTSGFGRDLFSIGYALTNNPTGAKIFRRFLALYFGKHLENTIDSSNPDVAIFTHPFIFPAAFFALDQRNIPSINVISNLTLHRVEFDPRATYTAVPTQEAYQFSIEKAGISPDRLLLSGWPVSSAFVPSKPPNSGNILLMSGGDGQGQVKYQVEALSRGLPNKTIDVVCGRNKRLYEVLTQRGFPNVRVLGFVDNIPELMRKSDIVITKAGPNTIMEALYIGRPLIITSTNGPQEKDNPRFVQENHFGLYNPDPSTLADTVKYIYHSYPYYIHPEKVITGGALAVAKTALSF